MRWTTLHRVFVLACFSLLTFAVLGVSPEASAQTSAKVHFEIAAQPLDRALRQFALQSKRQVIFDPAAVPAKAAPAIEGDLTPEEVLKALLEGTGLSFTVGKGATLIIRPTTATSTSGESKTGAGTDLPSSPETDQQKAELSEIVVTGTHIRGVPPVGSEIETYSRADIDQSGAATLDQFARLMPGNFSNTDTISNSYSSVRFATVQGDSNSFNGAGFNLRGLGAASTLTLLDGHRIAPAGDNGSFVDISMIPVSAIDHIDVLTDGASAIYGADAVGGVVNIVTRRDFDGAESRVRYGSSTAGGADNFAGSQLLGKSWGSGNVFLNYDYNWDGGLDASQRAYIPDQGGPFSLLPEDHRNSAFISGNQQVGEQTTLSGDALYSKRAFSSIDTTNSALNLTTEGQSGASTLTGGTLGVEHSFSDDRHASLTGDYSQMRQSIGTDINESVPMIGPVFSGIATSSADTEEYSIDAQADGTIMPLAGRAIKAAFGASYRADKYDATSGFSEPGFTQSSNPPSLRRHVDSAFGELFVPVVGESNALPMVKRLDISVAGRYDHYSDFGSTTNPKVALRWSPVSGLDFRGTYGTSYRAPLLSQLGAPQISSTTVAPNPTSPTGVTDLLEVSGGNPNLAPQKATTFGAGFDIRPLDVPSLLVSADYFHIDYRDEIETPPIPSDQFLFTNPIAAPFLNRNPSLAEVLSYFNSPGFQGDGAIGPNGQPLGPAGVQAIFNDLYANIASSRESGVDLRAQYSLDTALGRFAFSTSVTRLLDFEVQTAPGAAPFTLLNTFSEPPKLKSQGVVSWTRGGLSGALTINYTGSYQNTLFAPSESIASWTTANLYLAYKTDESMPLGGLRGITLALIVNNITDEKPPRVDFPQSLLLPGQSPVPYDAANASPVGRLIAISLTKRW
jgi:outer membrane receptor protein involved in Fe transport